MRFSLGQIDVAEKVGIGYFFTFGDGVFGDKEYVIGPFNAIWMGDSIYLYPVPGGKCFWR